jgi:hypothetical protein
MEKTLEQIDEEISALYAAKAQIEKETLESTIYGMFVKMTKDEVLMKIKQMMDASPMLKDEVKRLLIDVPLQN